MRSHRPLAHLNALRAFEAVARHLSVTKAAAELGVSRGAISQQVRLLEGYYRAPLLRRQNRRLSLTERGAAVLPDLTLAFDRLSAAARRLQEPSARSRIRISAPPSLAATWLMERMAGFLIQNPTIEVSLESTDRVVALDREGVDVALRYSPAASRPSPSTALFDETLTPVCAPTYLARHSLRTPADLARAALIRDDTLAHFADYPTWKTWFGHAGMEQGPREILSVSSSIMALQAALNGQGVILGRSILAAEAIRAGRLVALFPHLRVHGWTYILVHAQDPDLTPPVIAFRRWLLEEVQATESAFPSEAVPALNDVAVGVAHPGLPGLT